MKLASLVSGGKDSMYSAYLSRRAGHSIEYLLGMVSENKESYMFHTHNIHLLTAISEVTGIPLILGRTKGIKEEELTDLKDLIAQVKDNIDGITTGAIASNYQKQRADKICAELGLQSIAPFWGRNPEEVLREMLVAGFEIVIVAVAAPPLDESWLGRKIDSKCIDELVELNKKFGIHVTGEGGEYDSVVTYCPLYSKKIEITEAEKVWDPKTKSGSLIIKKVRVVDKK
ncbi:MAG: TIGR00289 family protein [Candidatus Aenigmarchaeota archaeon]|nr:TIGR00289 family protein [Candidatus Aenigmarchaeota archaeon]